MGSLFNLLTRIKGPSYLVRVTFPVIEGPRRVTTRATIRVL